MFLTIFLFYNVGDAASLNDTLMILGVIFEPLRAMYHRQKAYFMHLKILKET